MTKVRGERGAVAVEMAILLPILLLCIAGIVDLGRLLFVQTQVTNAAREGARMKSLGYTDLDATTRVRNASPGLLIPPLDVAPTYVACPASPGPTSQASATVNVTGFDWLILGDIMTLVGGGPAAPTPSSTATMRCLG